MALSCLLCLTLSLSLDPEASGGSSSGPMACLGWRRGGDRPAWDEGGEVTGLLGVAEGRDWPVWGGGGKVTGL